MDSDSVTAQIAVLMALVEVEEISVYFGVENWTLNNQNQRAFNVILQRLNGLRVQICLVYHIHTQFEGFRYLLMHGVKPLLEVG